MSKPISEGAQGSAPLYFKTLSTYSRAPIEVIIVGPVGHQAAFIDKLLLEVNCREAVFDGKLDNPLSFLNFSLS